MNIKKLKDIFLYISIIFLSLCLYSCSSPNISNTGRTAVEQFLLSTVIENGISYANFSKFEKKKIFIEYDYLNPQTDKSYIQGIFEMHLAEQDIIVCKNISDADYIIQILCGVLATDMSTFMIGSPSFPIPIPDTSINIAIPEIPIFKKLTRSGYGSFAFNILTAKDRLPIKSIKRIDSSSSFTNWTILLIPFKSHNMPLQIQKDSQTTFNFDHGNI